MIKKSSENVAVLIRVPKPLLKRLDSVAREQDRSRSYVVVEHIKHCLQAKRSAKAGVAA